MTNEEIVSEIQRGADALIPELWQRVEKFVRMQADRFSRQYYDPAIDSDDYYQCGYFALCKAIESFKNDGCSFISWLAYFLDRAFKTQISFATGRPNIKYNAVRNSRSLDELVYSDNDEIVLADIIPSNGEEIQRVIDEIYTEQLHEAIEKVIDTLPELQAFVLREYAWHGYSMKKIAELRLLSEEEIIKAKKEAFRQFQFNLRKTPEGRELEKFIDDNTNFYSGLGLETYQHTFESPIERMVLKRDREREKLKERFKK